ncbi:unnamed protein product [marine sediment metagenome]|uniref:Uncharacterized protein n=1 Tax=marine sediment metagenome TaxID=412755 RepID=X1I647_9ZZZZ
MQGKGFEHQFSHKKLEVSPVEGEKVLPSGREPEFTSNFSIFYLTCKLSGG